MAFEVDLEKATPLLGDLMNVPMEVRTTKERKAELMKRGSTRRGAARG